MTGNSFKTWVFSSIQKNSYSPRIDYCCRFYVCSVGVVDGGMLEGMTTAKGVQILYRYNSTEVDGKKGEEQ